MSSQNVGTDVLRKLHRVHRQLTDLRERLEHGPKQIRAVETSVTHQQQMLTQLHTEAKTVRMAVDAKQLELRAAEDKLQEFGNQLKTVSSNREYQVLKDQIATKKVTNSLLDEEILEGWEKMEELEGKTAQAEAAVASVRQRVEQVRAQVEKNEPLIRGDLMRLETELKECEAALPATTREFYHRVVRQRGEDALAAVENQFCSGCHQHVPLNVCAEIMLSHPMFCKSCGRLLYMAEEGTPAE